MRFRDNTVKKPQYLSNYRALLPEAYKQVEDVCYLPKHQGYRGIRVIA